MTLLTFSPHLLHCAVSFLPQSLAKCPGIPHKKKHFPLLGILLNSLFTASAIDPLYSFYLYTMLSWKICSLFPNSVKIVAGLKFSCLTIFSYIIGRPLRYKALKRVPETASPVFCSLEGNSCPLMKKLSKSSSASSYSQTIFFTTIATI